MKIHMILLGVFAASPLLEAASLPDIVWQTNAHFSGVVSVGFSGDSQRFVSGSPDRYAKVWDVSASNLVREFYTPNEWVLAVALSSDGSFLGTGGDEGKTRVWRVSDGARTLFGGPNEGLVYSLCFSSNDSFLGIGRSDGINVWSMQTGYGIPFGEPPNNQVFAVCFSPDGQRLTSANENFNASLWRVPEGTLVHDFVGHSDVVNSVDFSPDGTLLATASADGTARIWNVTNTAALLVIDGGGGVAKFSADAKLLYTLKDGTFKIWRVAGGACAGSITNTGALTFDIAKNGKYIAYGTGSGSVVLAHMPLVFDEFSRSGNQITLHWQGGTGLYQLQSSTNFASGVWQNVGSSTTNTSETNVIASGSAFYRVQSLSN